MCFPGLRQCRCCSPVHVAHDLSAVGGVEKEAQRESLAQREDLADSHIALAHTDTAVRSNTECSLDCTDWAGRLEQ